ncbi:PLP-dependent aminotransferase family protein [Geodermatophilus nigrescens]|uniref:Transcriptional regulator, GntR family n=1 Tax=Geodermatophilus nigrescens TaxID=1070870 RepID=A0A1M5JBD1_9ACTN|nr:PLP-dependent aminotransferase family protein [Geodermatophilus nigrescens]SHG37867.1 transcriptional regulator, GntR family [Geodermatophilus nigrescens]
MAYTGDLFVPVDRAAATPLSVQIAASVRAAVLGGALGPGDTLPPTRTLAADLGVSRGVVVTAYEQLVGEGFATGRRGGGTVVAVRPDVIAARPAAAPPSAPSPSAGSDVVDLTPGRPATRLLDDAEWRSAWRRAVADDLPAGPPDPLGLPALRQAVAVYLRRVRGVEAGADDVLVTAGASDALALAATALGAPGRPPRVVVEDPSYPAARRVLATAGAVVVPLPVDADGPRVADLRALSPAPDAVLLTPSHQYPLGGRMPVQERVDLLRWAAEEGVVVLEDDYDSEFRHRRRPLPAMASLPSPADVVLVGSWSKTLSPWLRCGWMVLRGAFGERLRAIRTLLDSPVSGVQQAALAHYLADGGLARHTARAQRHYNHRRSMVAAALGERPDVTLGALDGGLHVVVHLRPGTDAAALVRAAAGRGVVVADLADYSAGPPASPGLVLGYGAPTDLELRRGLAVLSELLDAA